MKMQLEVAEDLYSRGSLNSRRKSRFEMRSMGKGASGALAVEPGDIDPEIEVREAHADVRGKSVNRNSCLIL
jgi:hypothetical protein